MRNDASFGTDHQAGAIENQTVTAAHLIYHHDWYLVIASNGDQHLAAEFTFAHPERGGGNVQHKIPARADQCFYRIEAVKALVPKMFVVPRVLTNGESHPFAAEIEQLLAAGRSKVAHFIEYVVCG